MRAVLVSLLLLTAGLGLPPAAGTGRAAEAGPAQLDPVVASVVRMLEEGVSSETIAAWLDRTGGAPGTPTADDLIALTRAGASPDLMRQILERAPAAPPPPAEVQRDATRAEPPRARPLPPSAVIPVRFEVRYAPQVVEYQTTPWDLFIYIDGRPVARGDGWAAHSTSHVDRLTFDQSLSPGRHVIRLLQEQHVEKSKRKGLWSHEARVFGEPIVLDLETVGDWQVKIEVEEGGGFFGEKRSQYAITRNGEAVSEGSGPAAKADDWPRLCEEEEDGLSVEKLDSKAGRRALKGCVRWASLWEDIQHVPDRSRVREEMQRSGFDPVPAAPR